MLTRLVIPSGEPTQDVIEYTETGVEVGIITGEISIVDQYIDEAIEEMTSEEGHFAASSVDQKYQERYDMLCLSYKDLCKKINWDGDFSSRDQYWNFASLVSVARFFQRYAVVGNDIVDTLDSLIIDNSVGSRRGYATWDKVVFNLGSVSNRVEFLQLIAHEFGHIFDLGAIQGVSNIKHKAFTEFGRKVFSADDLSLTYYAYSWRSEQIRKSGSTNKDFCSGYGMSDPFEDFAECFNLYVYHNALFKAFTKNNLVLTQKYNFIAGLFDGKYLRSTSSDLSVVQGRTSWRPWDTTRIVNIF